MQIGHRTEILKADVSSVSPSSERRIRSDALIRSDESSADESVSL